MAIYVDIILIWNLENARQNGENASSARSNDEKIAKQQPQRTQRRSHIKCDECRLVPYLSRYRHYRVRSEIASISNGYNKNRTVSPDHTEKSIKTFRPINY